MPAGVWSQSRRRHLSLPEFINGQPLIRDFEARDQPGGFGEGDWFVPKKHETELLAWQWLGFMAEFPSFLYETAFF
jgi:hypothetical protein